MLKVANDLTVLKKCTGRLRVLNFLLSLSKTDRVNISAFAV